MQSPIWILFFENIHRISDELIEQGSESTKKFATVKQSSEYVLKKKKNSTNFKSGDDQAVVI